MYHFDWWIANAATNQTRANLHIFSQPEQNMNLRWEYLARVWKWRSKSVVWLWMPKNI